MPPMLLMLRGREADAGRSSRAVEGVLVYRDTLPVTGQQSRSVLQPHNVGVDQRASVELLGQLRHAEREQPTRPAGRLRTVQLSTKMQPITKFSHVGNTAHG